MWDQLQIPLAKNRPPGRVKIVNDDESLSVFTLTKMSDIQQWYGALQSLATSCNIYVPAWTDIDKSSGIMGKKWFTHVPPEIQAMFMEMHTAIHHLLSIKDLFSG